MPKMTVPGQAGMKGKLKNAKQVQPPQNPSIKSGGQWNVQWSDDDHRKNDVEKLPKDAQKPRKLDANTIMQKTSQVFQQPNGKVTDYIKKFDGQNSSGAIKNHLDILDKLLKKGDSKTASLTGMLGSGMMSSIQSSVNQQKQMQCPPGQRLDINTNKCVLDCPQGQVWDEGQQKCVPNDSNYNPNNNQDGTLNYLVVKV